MSEHRWVRDVQDPDPGATGIVCEKCGVKNYITRDGRPSVWLMVFTKTQDCNEILTREILEK